MWMSEAPRLMASVRMMFTSRTTGRFVRFLGQGVDVELFRLLVQDLEIAGAGVLVEVFLHLLELEGVGGAVVLVDRGADRGPGGDHRLDVVVGHELDVVHREDVGRIEHRDSDLGPGLGHRHDGVFAGDVGGDDLDHRVVDVDARQVDRRDLEVFEEELDQRGLLDQAYTPCLSGCRASSSDSVRRLPGITSNTGRQACCNLGCVALLNREEPDGLLRQKPDGLPREKPGGEPGAPRRKPITS